MEVNETIGSVVVVGGGTAGWITAAKLAKRFNSTSEGAVSVTLIESPDIPTIGVGEGTWPTMRKTLASLGIDESEFIRTCNASFKQGSKFVNWKAAPTTTNNHYYHLFSSIADPAEFNLSPYWRLGYAGTKSYAEAVSTQGYLSDLCKAPKAITSKAYDGIQSYAYHLDAGKFAELLKKHAIEKLGVKFLSCNVTDVMTDTDGITGVMTDQFGEVAGDFFVDCSGFSCLLLGQTLGVPFKSVSDVLFTDYAVAIQVPYNDPQCDINSCTISTAQEAGWIWDIGLQNRRGVGHVYSSEFMSHEQAEKLLREYIGEDAHNLPAKLVKMNVGYREKFWHKNCVAIGMSAAFVEPLEASAIFLIEAASNMLADQLPKKKSLLNIVANKFNESFLFRWNRTIDFIKLHYVLSERDEPFWVKNKNKDSIPQSLQDSLEQWATEPVSPYDFSHVYDPFPMESYQYVLNGMNFNQDLSAGETKYSDIDNAKRAFGQIEKYKDMLIRDLPSNRELLNKLSSFSFSKV
ncbi:tryptophan 7-halogenase [Pseudoalteromonas sp. JBTF-M23]|uniref:Tryptophan 7-halogenase n=1 Tax=Pseudoalteromonas caenipelagi TaxID=2726988 RepID=A0A849VB74_9GAMM|nr:tryptophan halogenase family protein [Pseudoalteromonas caenipelagi]NOU50879.1 tryptophan 7-halogenase [Pseudoalteromonas caenipelagi]